MRCRWFIATSLFVTAQLFYGVPKSHAADLQWEVENPYRFFKHGFVRGARKGVRRGARRGRTAVAQQYPVAGGTPPERSRLQKPRDTVVCLDTARKIFRAKPPRLGIAQRSISPVSTVTRARAAT